MRTFIFLFIFLFPLFAYSQSYDPTEDYALLLVNVKDAEGLPQAHKQVLIVPTDGETEYLINTNSKGGGQILLPIGKTYTVKSSCDKTTITVSDKPYQTLTQKLICSDLTDAVVKNNQIKSEVFKNWPDSTYIIPGATGLKPTEDLALVKFQLRDFKGNPLANETIKLKGITSNKVIFTLTGNDGRVEFHVPKGDNFSLSFKYDPNYDTLDYPTEKNFRTTNIEFDYEGTLAIEKRIQDEKDRIEKEKLRLEEEKIAYEKYLKESTLSAIEATKKYILEYEKSNKGVEVKSIFERNKNWKNKLIVTDVTGSMSPYSAQLMVWFKAIASQEKDAQFVFFNDGDNKADEDKIIGETGGIYYGSHLSYDQLLELISKAKLAGGGGDVAENNIEAITKGIAQASPFTELIMIADNYAPVKDISLLSQVKVPVRIILCGSTEAYVQPDYLKIAHDTKGSVHTLTEDITNIGQLVDGEELKIGALVYRLDRGKFKQVDK